MKKNRINIVLLIVLIFLMFIFAILVYINNNISSTKSTNAAKPAEEEIYLSPTLIKMQKMSQEELILKIEDISNDELIDIAYGTNAVLINNLVPLDTFSADLDEDEKWYTTPIWLAGSVSIYEEAEKIALNFANLPGYSGNVVYIGDNDLYYEFRVERKINQEAAFIEKNRMIFFKDSVVTFGEGETYNRNSKNEFTTYSIDDAVFKKIDYDTVLSFFDGLNYLSPSNLLYRYMQETDKEINYIEYTTSLVGGDWGLNDTASLLKTTYSISKETGILSINKETLKDNVEIPGSAPDSK